MSSCDYKSHDFSCPVWSHLLFLHSFIQLFTSTVYYFALTNTYMTCMLCMWYFAGMEVAAALTDKAHSVSVIGIESVPFKKALGEKVGKAIMKVGKLSWEIRRFRTWSTSKTQSSLLFYGKKEKPLACSLNANHVFLINTSVTTRKSMNVLISQHHLVSLSVCGVFSLCSCLRQTGWSSTCWMRCQRWLAIMDRYSESERNSLTWCSAAL